MAKDLNINIGTVTIGAPHLTKNDFVTMIAAIFGAYRASGKSEKDAYVAALKDANWLAPKLQSLLSESAEALSETKDVHK